MLELRPYQRQALDSLYSYWDKDGGSPLIVLPTGAGKSLVIATLMQELLTNYPDMRILNVTHVKELLTQNYRELLGIWPFAPAGMYSAGLGQADANAQIIFGGVQTIANKAHRIGHIDLVLVDEAHLVPRKADTQYGKLLTGLRDINPDLRMAGLTATDYRLGEGRLTEGDGAMFDAVAFEKPVGELIDDGYLCRPVSKGMETGYDLDGVGKVGGDYNQGKLQAAVDKEAVTRAAIDEVMRYGANRKAWLFFCAGVEHAYHVRDEIRSRGITCETVAGETPAPERDRILADFKEGRIRAVTNNSVLTTGFNHPGVDLLALMRPTLSTSLYIQMIGRGLRNAPGKENCIAEGQRVLTDRGLIQIEDVTTDMKVWDGVNFVSHDGAVCRGVQTVIEYSGLVATEDHEVMTKDGWKKFKLAAETGAPIRVTGIGGSPIREIDCHYRNSLAAWEEQSTVSGNEMLNMRSSIGEGLYKSNEGAGWLQKVRQSKAGAAMAGEEVRWSEAKMHKSERRRMGEIRRARDSVQLSVANGNGCVGAGKSGAASGNGNRQGGQRWALRGWQSEVLDSTAEPFPHEKADAECAYASIQVSTSRNQVRGQHASQAHRGRIELRGNRGEVPQAITQAKRRVWDILNAGPLHRFTVEGLLVHNCLVLDFAGCVRKHGPIDAVRIKEPGKGEGEAPVKQCPECESLVHASARVCPDCGYEFPPNEGAKHAAQADITPVLSTAPPVWHAVTGRTFREHPPKPGKPPSIRCDYRLGLNVQKEWLCPEHAGFAQAKAHRFWSMHGGARPFPKTVAEFLDRAGELKVTAEIQLRPNGRYQDVIGWKAGEASADPEPANDNWKPLSAAGDDWDDDIPF